VGFAVNPNFAQVAPFLRHDNEATAGLELPGGAESEGALGLHRRQSSAA